VGAALDLEEQRKGQVMRGDGEMAALMRALDWSKLPAGPVSMWSEPLRTAVSICLGSRHPVEIWWGPEFLRFYNDAYRPILGANKHPQFIGRPGRDMWAEIWDVIEPLLRRVVETGEASWYEDFQLFVTRNGFLEETYFSFSYGPVYEEGKVAGIFSPCTETTAHVLQNRRLRLLRKISVEGTAETLDEAIVVCTRLLGEDTPDVPFALVYLFDPKGARANLVSSTGLKQVAGIFPESIDLKAVESSPFGDISGVAQGAVLLKDLDKRFDPITAGPWNQTHERAAVLPLRRAVGDELAGLLVVGISARLPYTDEYRVFFDLLAAQLSNIVARTAALVEERKRSESFAGMFNGAPAFMAVLRGPEHVFEMANPRYMQLIGHRDLIGKTVRAAVPEVEGQGFFEFLDNVYRSGEAFHGDSIKIELRRTPDSAPETRYLTFVYQPLTDVEGRVTGIFVLGSDVTENVAAHEALRRSEKLSAAGRLAATIAHEVNNPLEAITNLLYLSKTGEPHEVKHFIELAEDELNRIAHITKQTLAFYKESTAPSVFDLSKTVESILIFYRKQAAGRGIDIEMDLGANCMMMGVEGEIKQVLSNLLSNAMDAFSGDRGTIRIRTRNLFGCVRLVVADSGRGIAPEALVRIWEPFFTTKEAVGTGLGLWVTREILDKHKARLRLRTTSEGKRRGTVFVIDFPAAEKFVVN
jgi:signal transduction histidine kinase